MENKMERNMDKKMEAAIFKVQGLGVPRWGFRV